MHPEVASSPQLRAQSDSWSDAWPRRVYLLLGLCVALSLAGCPQSTPDAQAFADAGTGQGGTDSSQLGDGAAVDSSPSDTAAPDSAGKDANVGDSGTPDATGLDTKAPDAGALDAGVADSKVADTGVADTGAPDAGKPFCTKDKDCDDNNPCTASQCTGGSCSTLPLTQWTSCGVGLQCVDTVGCVPTVQGGTYEIRVGKSVSCAMTADDKAWCWGRNEYGQVALGNTTGTAKGVLWPTQTVLGKVQDISLAWSYGCAVSDKGILSCWGSNTYGQLALGPGVPKLITKPTKAKTSEKFAKVTLGLTHGCAIRDDGVVFCWGIGAAGQLGDGLGKSSTVPVKTIGVSGVEELALGEAFSCARNLNGAVFCWGANHTGQLGDGNGGTSKWSNKPVQIKGITGFIKNVAAGRGHACVLVGDDVWCWGANGSGQLGNGSIGQHKPAPAKVYGLTFKPDAIALGGNTSCAYEFDGKVACWGSNEFGVIKGPASNTPVKLPELVPGLVGISDLAVGDNHVCARIFGNQVACWGDNYSGQLGVGPGVAKSSTPKVAGHPAP